MIGKKLYVGGLPYSVSDEELEELFSEHGTVESARVIMDKMTGRSRGFGFVEMSSPAEAQAACEQMNGASCKGAPWLSTKLVNARTAAAAAAAVGVAAAAAGATGIVAATAGRRLRSAFRFRVGSRPSFRWAAPAPRWIYSPLRVQRAKTLLPPGSVKGGDHSSFPSLRTYGKTKTTE